MNSHIVYTDDGDLIGNSEDFLLWAKMKYRYVDKTDDLIYEQQSKKLLIDSIDNSETRSYVYLEFHYNFGLDSSKVIIELFEDVCPKTCHNFKELCKGFKRDDG